jgi:glycosyltransferase involved in cell wall biosynthesis
MADTKPRKLKIIAGMPAFNEDKYVGSLVLKVREYVDEVFVVDDGSSDDTARVAKLAGADVIVHGGNKGYGAAIQSIITEAKKRDPDILVILDTDAQHEPKEIPNIIKPIIDNTADFVIGTRHKQEKKIPFYRRIGQKVILSSVKTLSKTTDITDSECGFRAFSRLAYNTLKLREKGMSISAETVAEATRQNLKIAQVPVSVTYNEDSSTLNPVKHGLNVMASIVSMISEQRPLYFFGLGGVALMTVGLAFGIRVLNMFAVNQILPIGNTMLSVLLLIIGSFSVFTALILRVLTRRK